MIARFFLIFLFSATACSPAIAQTPPVIIPAMRTDTIVCAVGSNAVHIVTSTYGLPHIRFLSIHDNEDTGVRAAYRFMQINGGSITELQYGGVRNIGFSDSVGNYYQIDPNSMFTDTGARGNLDRYGDGLVTPEAVAMIRKLGDSTLAIYNPDSLGYIVTLHNNTDKAFSIKSYLPGDYLQNTAGRVHVSNEMDADDLVLVTEPWFFDYLQQQNVNAIYQSPDAPNDGSLSVFAQMSRVPYVNIEVQHGHDDEHYRLIVIVNEMIKQYLAEVKGMK